MRRSGLGGLHGCAGLLPGGQVVRRLKGCGLCRSGLGSRHGRAGLLPGGQVIGCLDGRRLCRSGLGGRLGRRGRGRRLGGHRGRLEGGRGGRRKGPDFLPGRLLGRCPCRGGRRLGGDGLLGLHGLGEAEQGQLQLDPLVAAPGHVLQGHPQGPDGPDGFPPAQGGAFFKVEGLLVGGDPAQQVPPAGQGRQHQAAVMGDQLFGEALDVHRLLPQGRQLGQGCGGIPGRHRVRHPEQVAAVGDACHLPYHIFVDVGGDAGAGVQDGQRVAQSAVGQPGDEGGGFVGEVQLFGGGHLGHPPRNVLGADAGEVVPLAPGPDGGGHLLDLGGGQDKDDVGGGLFQCFQQGIEGRCGKHVHLVDDVYLISAAGGGVGGLVPQVADVVHAVVGGGVHLHHVQDGAVVDALADGACPAGVAAVGVEAVDRLGEDFGAGGFACAPHPGEQVGVAHPPGGHLVFQRRHGGALAHHVLKPLGPPFAVERSIHSHTSPESHIKKADSAAGEDPPPCEARHTDAG